MTISEVNEIIADYQNNLSIAEISRQRKLNKYFVKDILVNNGVSIRSRKEQNFLTNTARKKEVNDNYFSFIDTYNKAWLLGYLASDGSVAGKNNRIKIGIAESDKEILEKIRAEVNIERKIKNTKTSNGFLTAELEWSSYQQKQDLAKYEIVNNKTYLPLHLPDFENDDNKKLAFILGYFDGDGSISVSKDNYLRMRFCSYRIEILQDFANFFEKKYNAKYSLSKDHKREMYELSISTTYAKLIFEDCYNLNTICLERKHKKYLEYKNHETTTT